MGLELEPIVTGSDGNLYILHCDNDLYFIECGIDYKLIIKYLYTNGYLISQVKGCFITHKHKDHTFCDKSVNRLMSIYTNRQVMEEKNYDGEILKPKLVYHFDNLSVMPINVEHGSAECYGYMFKASNKSILFITDCFKFEDVLKTQFDEIYIECNWTEELIMKELELTKDTPQYTKFERQYQTHMGLDNLKLILKKSLNLSNCKKITLIHPSKEVCDKELVLKELREMYPDIEINFAKNKIEGVVNGIKRITK